MDKKSKIFLALFFLAIFISVGVTYYKIIIKRDYIVEAQTDCDPETEKCFVWECDPNSNIDGEKCVGDPEKDIWYYKIISKNAGWIPLCDPNKDENCQALVCADGESDCGYTLCDEETKKEQGVECGDPEEYAKNNQEKGGCDSDIEGLLCNKEEDDDNAGNTVDAETNDADAEVGAGEASNY